MTPDDVLLARAIRALRDAVVLCGAGCLALAVVAAGVIALAGPDATLGPTALTILGGGQLIALVGAVFAGLGLRAALSDAPAGAGTGAGTAVAAAAGAVSTVRGRLRFLVRAVLVWCVGTAAGWALAVPSRVVITLALAAVAAQLAVLLLIAVRRLERPTLEG